MYHIIIALILLFPCFSFLMFHMFSLFMFPSKAISSYFIKLSFMPTLIFPLLQYTTNRKRIPSDVNQRCQLFAAFLHCYPFCFGPSPWGWLTFCQLTVSFLILLLIGKINTEIMHRLNLWGSHQLYLRAPFLLIIGRRGSHVGYVLDFHPCRPGLNPA